MKFALMLAGLGLGLALGFMPAFRARRPLWWRILTIVLVSCVVVLALAPPIAGTFTDAVVVGRMDDTKSIPVLLQRTHTDTEVIDGGRLLVQVADSRDDRVVTHLRVSAFLYNESPLPEGKPTIVYLRRAESDVLFDVDAIGTSNPALTLPYIIGLEERARIIFFHVPMSWIAFVAYVISMVFGIRYLRTRDLRHDSYSAAAAGVGTLFCVLATLTGSVWAKFNWGSFWNWDPRETSILVLLLVYASYFVLRSAIIDESNRARLSAIYASVGSVTAAFLIFVLPRMMTGLHPGSANDSSMGPLLSPKSDEINVVKQVLFSISLTAFTLVYFWLVNLRFRLYEANRSIQRTPSP
jgi:heme exporter protein C